MRYMLGLQVDQILVQRLVLLVYNSLLRLLMKRTLITVPLCA